MRVLSIWGMMCLVAFSVACGGNGHGIEAPSPPTATSTPAMSSAEVISFVQQYQVLETVEGGFWQAVPLVSRVEKFCMDAPSWSARETTLSWRVFAECTKEESVPADNPLRFEWLFYADKSLVMPHNHPAHVAQSEYPW